MINPISISNITTYPKRSVSFGSIERTVYKNHHKDVLYKNNSFLLRKDLEWNMLAKHIIKENPKNIYCYACSDGSEPYSIAISLISKLGYENAQKYFPIIARDIDLDIINKASTGAIYITKKD